MVNFVLSCDKDSVTGSNEIGDEGKDKVLIYY